MEYLDKKFDQIDLVGTMDTPEEFAQWWVALGDMAGFDASLPERDNEAPSAGNNPLAAAAVITAATGRRHRGRCSHDDRRQQGAHRSASTPRRPRARRGGSAQRAMRYGPGI